MLLLDGADEENAKLFAIHNGVIFNLQSNNHGEVFTPISDSDVILIDGEGDSLSWVSEASPLTANIIS